MPIRTTPRIHGLANPHRTDSNGTSFLSATAAAFPSSPRAQPLNPAAEPSGLRVAKSSVYAVSLHPGNPSAKSGRYRGDHPSRCSLFGLPYRFHVPRAADHFVADLQVFIASDRLLRREKGPDLLRFLREDPGQSFAERRDDLFLPCDSDRVICDFRPPQGPLFAVQFLANRTDRITRFFLDKLDLRRLLDLETEGGFLEEHPRIPWQWRVQGKDRRRRRSGWF